MADKNKVNVLKRDLFDLPFLRKLRRWWFLRRLRGERGNATRTLLFLDLSGAVRLNTPLDVALELIAEGYEAVEVSWLPKLGGFDSFMAKPEQMVKLLASYLLPWVRQGLSLAEAMERLGAAFSVQEIQIVALGERTGMLPQALRRLGEYRQADLRLQRIKQYLMYPVYIATLATIIVSFILVFIIPKFQDMFTQLGGQLPYPTRLLIEASRLLIYKSYLVLFYGTLFWIGLRGINAWLGRSSGTTLFERIPLFGRLHRTVREARWLAALALNLEAGVGADQALRQAGGICGGALERRSLAAAALVEGGHAIGEACIRCLVLERWINHRLQLIDWRGNYIESIRGIVEDADRRVTEAMERFGQRAEIFSIITVGLLVAGMVIALYLPLFNIPRLVMNE